MPAMAAAQVRDQPREVTVNAVSLRGTIQAIDQTARTVVIKGDKGNLVTLDVPPSVTRLDEVKVGDIVTITYYDRVSLRLKPAGEAAVDRVVEPTTMATAGALPGATRSRQRIATATITAWDPATRQVDFTGPKGNTYSRYVATTIDPSVLAGIKVGDRVDVTWTEALSLQVSSATPAADPDDFRHRVTFSVQFGIDNQFSGKLIKEATGTRTNGAPINLNETTFDDVYGRIGMFKIGAGYRTSPRSEGVFNFVWSKSDAQESAILVGTAGTSQVPLNVTFSAYEYWGFEGGQRFYFARTRFTPYLGYLVGINRFQEIFGTFAGVPPPDTPVLANTDGSIFDNSWAISLGPTGGVLIGVGPFEVMGEVQLRYIGGLSDVDWLVEEGLSDVNDESSRWSFPLMIGARIRF